MGNSQCACCGCVGCFLVLACVHHCLLVVGVGAFWVGHKSLKRMSTLSGSRSTPCWRPPLVVVVARIACLGFEWFGCGCVCGGLFVICIVVASIFVLYCFLCFV